MDLNHLNLDRRPSGGEAPILNEDGLITIDHGAGNAKPVHHRSPGAPEPFDEVLAERLVSQFLLRKVRHLGLRQGRPLPNEHGHRRVYRRGDVIVTSWSPRTPELSTRSGDNGCGRSLVRVELTFQSVGTSMVTPSETLIVVGG